ncbi:hypothetical protein WJX73_003696 [Symbiochloris irregularis]|uniref:Uncharacterized protein n=1 Tax=Symbiochloris irregularis TaxID=706552 RepID=A0AAW1P3U1_9CHLO
MPARRPSAWRKVIDAAQAYLSSSEFRSSLQAAAGTFITSLFIFVRQMAFSGNTLLGVLVPIGLLRLSPNLSTGARIFSTAAMLLMAWVVVLSGTLVQVARVTGAYPVWLSIFTVLVYGCISVLRVISGTQGYIQSVIFAIAIIIGQFADKLWLQALSGITSCLMPPWPQSKGPEQSSMAAKDALRGLKELVGLEAFGDEVDSGDGTADIVKASIKQPELTAESLHEAVMQRQSVQGYRSKRADPKADHAARCLQGPVSSTRIDAIFPAMLKGSRLSAVAKYEPMWLGKSRVELSEWGAVYEGLHTLSLHIASLQSNLEAHEPVVMEPAFEAAFGVNPLPSFRQVSATVAASLACMAGTAQAASAGRAHPVPCRISTDAQGHLLKNIGLAMLECHRAWKAAKLHPDNLSEASELLHMPLENRMLIVLKSQTEALLGASVRLEGIMHQVLDSQRQFPMLSSCRCSEGQDGQLQDVKCEAPQKGTESHSQAAQHSRWRARLCLEVQPLLECFWTVAGQPVWEPVYKAFKADFLTCFGSFQKAWHTARNNQSFAFGLSFFIAGAGALLAIQQTTQQVLIIRTWHSFYIAVTIASTMQEHVDYAVTRGVFRLVTSALGGVLGYVVMLRPRLASNTYALTAIVCSHGSIYFFIARVSEYAIGVGLAWLLQFLFPRFLAADALKGIGGATCASAELMRDINKAYFAELRHLEGASSDSQDAKNDDKPGSKAEGFEKLSMKDLYAKIAKPLGAVQLAIARETVVWSAGPLVLPALAKKGTQNLQALLERASLMLTMARPENAKDKEYTAAIYHSLLQQVEGELMRMVDLVVELGAAANTALEAHSTSTDLEHLSEAIQAVEHQRIKVQDEIKAIRLETRRKVAAQSLSSAIDAHQPDSLHDAMDIEPCTNDDAERALGLLIANGKYTDKLLLFAKLISNDDWLRKRASRTGLQQDLLYY